MQDAQWGGCLWVELMNSWAFSLSQLEAASCSFFGFVLMSIIGASNSR